MTGSSMLADTLLLDPSRAVALSTAASVLILYVLAIGLILQRRLGAQWRWIGLGALLQVGVGYFVISWILALLVHAIYPNGLDPQFHPAILLAFTALTAILLEAARWAGYRFVMREPAGNWSNSLMYGLGDGGATAIIFYAIGTLLTVSALVTNHANLSVDDARKVDLTIILLNRQQIWALLASPFSLLWYIPAQMGLSALVWASWKRRQIVYLLLAMIVHTLFAFWQQWIDLRGQQSPNLMRQSVLLSALLTTVYGLLALALILSLRPKPQASPNQMSKNETQE